MCQRRHKRSEQVGEKTQQHKTGRRLHHVEHATLAHNNQQQQGIHHDGLDTDGKRYAMRGADRLNNGGKACDAAGGKAVGDQKQVCRDSCQGAAKHNLGQVMKEVHRKNALDVQTICHAASLKKAHPNECALNFLLYSILPIHRANTTPAKCLHRPGANHVPRQTMLPHRRCRLPNDGSRSQTDPDRHRRERPRRCWSPRPCAGP